MRSLRCWLFGHRYSPWTRVWDCQEETVYIGKCSRCGQVVESTIVWCDGEDADGE